MQKNPLDRVVTEREEEVRNFSGFGSARYAASRSSKESRCSLRPGVAKRRG